MKDDHPMKIQSRLNWERRNQAAEAQRAKRSLQRRKRNQDAKAGRATLILQDIEK